MFVLFIVVTQSLYSQKQRTLVKSTTPAYPYPIEYIQPDGSILIIYLKGDAVVNWAETTDRYTVLKGSSGGYEYAKADLSGKIVPSGIKATNPEYRTINEITFLQDMPKELKYSKKQVDDYKSMSTFSDKSVTGVFPSIGTSKMLVILVNFNNTTTTYSQTNFDNYMNQSGYNFQSSTGSFRDYYLDNSYNLLDINTTVVGWVTVSQQHDYYGPENKWAQLAYDAIVAAHNANPSLDFSQFDNDGDGQVDGVAIFHQGPGQESTSYTGDVWSHTGSLTSSGLVYNGKTFGGYTMQPELLGSSSSMITVGVMCHEFGHNMGLPDLYDVNYTHHAMGIWDIMSGGSWINYGRTPCGHNAWSKYVLDWMNPIVINSPATLQLQDASSYSECYMINTPTVDEYFLLENRQKLSGTWDIGLPGHGLIIYHVDETWIVNNIWSVNSTANHQGLDIEEADGTSTTTNDGDGGDPFPGSSNKTGFTDNTVPGSHSWAGASLGKPITNITENTTTHVITFDFMGGNPSEVVANFVGTPVTIPMGSSVVFVSSSTAPNGTTLTDWQWTFDGGTPSTFSGEIPPAIVYNTVGTFDVSLTVTNSTGQSDSKIKTGYITVTPVATSEWIVQSSGYPTASTGCLYLSVVDNTTAWAIANDGSTGGAKKEFSKTTNGTSWTSGIISGSGVQTACVPSSITAVDGNNAWITMYSSVVGQSGIFKTSDGGQTWNRQTTATFAGSAAFPNVVHFFNANEGFCMGDPNGGYFEIYTTINGGTTWTRVSQANIPAPLSGEYGYVNMYDNVGNSVWFTTNKGRIYKSVNKGFNWTVSQVPGFTDFSQLVFNDVNNGIAIQATFDQTSGAVTAFAMKVTYDGGTNWITVSNGNGMYYSDFDGIPGMPGKFVSIGKNYDATAVGSSYTTDYGATWINIDQGTQYISVKFVDDNIGWAGGFNTSSTSDGIYKWHNLTVSISENHISTNNEPEVYPNPATGIVNIRLYGVQKEQIKIKVYNLTGIIVYEKSEKCFNYEYVSKLDLTNLTNGIYIVVVETSNQVSNKKVLIE